MRQQIIETIEKLRRGESFQAFKEKFVIDQDLEISDEELKKLYISYNFIDSVIEKLISYCPNIEKVKIKNGKKREFVKNSLIEIGWSEILNETYDTLESSGDSFYEIYFQDSEDKIPRLRVLNSKNMLRAIMDSYNNYKYYIYKEWVEDSIPIYTNGSVVSSRRERIIVFEKGKKTIFDPQLNGEGEYVTDKNGSVQYNVEVIENRDSYIADFSLVHIKGKKRQREEFSSIPAEKYIDPSLTLDQITSDTRQINRMLGYPLIMIVDGRPVRNAKRTPGGLFGVVSTSPDDNQAKVQDIQISNKLDSIFSEFDQVRDDLYDKVGLITPTLRQKLNVDSARVVQQLNLQSENKIELYVDNIINAMRLWFKILLKENDLYSERTDKNLTFIKPKFIIKSSPFDELLYTASEIEQTNKSRKETYIENMDSEADIKDRIKEVNEELGDKNKDKSFEKEIVNDVMTRNGVDNRLKGGNKNDENGRKK